MVNDRNIISDTNGNVLDQLYGVPTAPQQQQQSVSRILTAPSVVQSVQGDPPPPFPAGEIDDYDFAAAKAAGVQPDDRGHWPDTYKRPNHITFSDESIFNDGGAGHWEKIDDHWYFTPGPTNLKYYSMEELRKYFRRFEPDVTLVEPKQAGEVLKMTPKKSDPVRNQKDLDEMKKMMTRDTLSRALGGAGNILPMTPGDK